jgi:hypothetical protein
MRAFKAGDRVRFTLYGGKSGIATITGSGTKNDKPVHDLDNGHWCYESQLAREGRPRCVECHREEVPGAHGRGVAIRLNRSGVCAACRCANEEIAADAKRTHVWNGERVTEQEWNRAVDALAPRVRKSAITDPAADGMRAAKREADHTIMSIPGSDDGAVATVYYVINLRTRKAIGRSHATAKSAAHALALIVNEDNDGACVNCCEPIDGPGAFCVECR